MKITMMNYEIAKAMSTVSKAVPGKTTLPILECVLIIAENSTIKVVANNMELGIETQVNGEIQEPGIVALDAKFFGEVVRRLPDGFVTISTNDAAKQATVSCGKTKFNLLYKDGRAFPAISKINSEESLVISQQVLKNLIHQTIFSVSDNENNRIMMGEYFEIKDRKLTLTALDGHRIAVRSVDIEQDFDVNAIIPGKTLMEVSRLLSTDKDANVKVIFSDVNVMFEFEGTTIVSRLIEGNYFNISQMVTNDFSTVISVDKAEFFGAIDRSTLLLKDGDKKPVVLDIDDNGMNVQMATTLGTLDENVELSKNGDDIKIGFNPRFLTDIFKVIDEDEVKISFINPKSPCFIKDDAGSYIYMVLPVNFNTKS